MEEMLRKLFEANPDKTTIVLKGKCSDCGCETIVEITSTSGGYGLQGGGLFKYSSDKYFMKCHNCYQFSPMTDDKYKLQRRQYR